ncbi:MAG: glycoside hydrolase family 13 protein [Fibrobacter intestinalis]|uniref:glycoside hydrolase family 13 protein n=1 Tax=Fibrobacter TaxID=832 RepID=UPI000BB11346|nr:MULTISPECIES: glycoside hydrolase family 13 protein [Fibrobacter]MDD7297921.1 glycoside hydrolase family 13 protein [Fibrobacter intestinalis]PBC68873.1 pullulanase /isoamylase [Fibrobacter sp. UWS1]
MSAPQDFHCPDWVRSAVFYQIFPDRFARSPKYECAGSFHNWGAKPEVHGFCGGNLRGIIEKLDYIQDLGANALYLCPIFKSAANHRYHTVDYLQIDPVLGTIEDFDELVREVHKREMRIILDGVFNHCSRGFFPFVSAMEEGEASPYKNWFHFHSFPVNAYSEKPNYDCWWGMPALPKFNTDNLETREYLLRVAEFWIRRGIDGWRLDVPNEIDDDDFWREFRRRVKKWNPEAYIVGEIWEDPSRWLAGDQFDGVMNYPVRKLALRFLFPEGMSSSNAVSTGDPTAVSVSGMDAAEFCNAFQNLLERKLFGVQMNLFGSHDTARLLTLAGGNSCRAAVAWALLLTLPGAISLYYGDEIGMEGGKDPDNRRCFPWQELPDAQNSEIFRLVQTFLAFRKREPAMSMGTFSIRPEGQGLLICRQYNKTLVELRLGFPGPVPLPGISARTEVIYESGKSPIAGVAGYFVAKDGIVLTKRPAIL